MKTLITGAAGFIGSNFVQLFHNQFEKIIIVDSLTYAGNMRNLAPLLEVEEVDKKNVMSAANLKRELSSKDSKIQFLQIDINEKEKILDLLKKNQINSIIHFAAESHVDNSILGPKKFIESNVLGTVSLLEATREYLKSSQVDSKNFKFVHVSTDEVFGSLGPSGQFLETTAYDPRSPYSASKAASDHFVRAWGHTYNIPFVITNCSNNFGPRQHNEKLIPVVIQKCLREENIPVYGDGSNIRDWIYVDEHCEGIFLALKNAKNGETFCFGGDNEFTNLKLVEMICDLVQDLQPSKKVKHMRDLISFVKDRPGHDWRYSIDSSKAKKDLGFKNSPEKMRERLLRTIQWYR